MKKIFITLLIAGFISSWCFAEAGKPVPQSETGKNTPPAAATVTKKKAKGIKVRAKKVNVQKPEAAAVENIKK